MFTRRSSALCALSLVLMFGCDPEPQVDDKQDQPADIADLGGSDLPAGGGLSSYAGISPTPLVAAAPALTYAADCDAVQEWLVRREIERWLRGEFAGASTAGRPWAGFPTGVGVDRDMGVPTENAPGVHDRSLPNVVDEAVGEPDVLVGRGEHLYAVYQGDDFVGLDTPRLLTYKAWPADQLTQRSAQVFNANVEGSGRTTLLSHGDELLMLRQQNASVQRYTLADPDSPTPVGDKLGLSWGGLRFARLIGGRLVVVSTIQINNDWTWSEALHQEMRAIAAPADLDLLPLAEAQQRARTLLLANMASLAVHVPPRRFALPVEDAACSAVALPSGLHEQMTVSQIVVMDAATLGDVKTSWLVAPIERHYTSPNALYITLSPTLVDLTGGQDAGIYRLPLVAGQPVKVKDRAALEGVPFSDFGMSEHEGHLRVVTDLGAGAKLTILGERAGVWGEVGSVGGIAPDERITATRAVGDQLYIMTAKGSGFTTPPAVPGDRDFVAPTDPLFIIDASSVEAPTILGELDFPGFSVHVEPVSATQLLSFGRAGDGTLRLQLFDITDRSAPTIAHEIPFSPPGWTSESDALTNRFSFAYHPARGLISIPSDDKLAVFKLDPAGFTMLGLVQHNDPSIFCPQGAQGCSPAFERFESRSLFIERFLYTFSAYGLATWDTSASPLVPTRALPFVLP